MIAVSTWLWHVVTIPARNWHRCYCVGVVADFLNVGADFLNNFLVSLLAIGWLSGIHFVNAINSCFTPRVEARRACSRVCPFLEIPASNSPTPAATIRTAQSAWDVPVITLQSCPTLCDPIDGSPPGSAVPGILQARTLEWVAISFSNA